MSGLELVGVSKSYQSQSILTDVSLSIERGEFAVFVGPSGCGKSTLLRLIAGLDPVTQGQISIDGQDVSHAAAGRRSVAMVFQSYALYPHMSVFENIAFPLQMARLSKSDVKQAVQKAAEIVKLDGRLGDKPAKLSGGQRQRVAIARAIVRQPAVFLMDEPLSNLDAALRAEMRMELTQLHRRLGTTMVYVTHDQLEAMTMADRIVVLNGGRVEQVGPPMELYHHPSNTFVARFIGSPPMNLVPCKVTESDAARVRVSCEAVGDLVLPFSGERLKAGDHCVIGIRPEAFRIGPPDSREFFSFQLVPQVLERLGVHLIAHAQLSAQSVTCLFDGDPTVIVGQPMTVHVAAHQVRIFDDTGAARTPISG
ncbi:ABC transporter ATP-binding protein [Rhizobium oryzicola]|uniref:ABC transporter ATP-binding protein n=1 Tax=Rhizobium oryzicola TaxID=1232668 RepID=A0ABT8SXQ9_9HYPH|nr:ABC transporter ATP-binding protein [Rhizobium oryzicola]MDO1582668.1 ABC transporter ATP-binding protein [Rhizobium oryzicola]